MEMDERLKNSSLPEIEKIKLHFIQNPDETVTMTGREFVDHLVEVERKAVEVTRGYVKADIEKLDRIANAFRDANHVLKAENARLREALEFYADPNSWIDESVTYVYSVIQYDDQDIPPEEHRLCDKHGGRRAREALKE